MPGFISWVSSVFSSRSPVPKPAPAPLPSAPQPKTSPQSVEGETDDYQKLNLYLFCWLLETTPLQLDKTNPRTTAVIAELRQKIRDGDLDELPRQPMTLPKILRAMSDPDGDRTELAKIILDDPALTDQLLQVANSPLFRPGEQDIESVDQAVFVLGLSGIRNVVSAALMRPMLSARYSREAVFSQRVWRWGLTCARAAELIAKEQNADASAYFMVGLLPALSSITLHREVHRILSRYPDDQKASPAMMRTVLETLAWPMAQKLAEEWNLPSRYRLFLDSAQPSSWREANTPLSDGILMGTREVLRHAHQRNLPEENLAALLSLSEPQFSKIRTALSDLLKRSG